ncbi:MAG TPA: hypothetical protein VF593_13015 [Chthoniobacteraceae bacterium]|jgi:uncharacterized protein YbaR (Trm112 family)
MDFLFSCPACHGPLLVRRALQGERVSCAHCATGLQVQSGHRVTEIITSIFLDGPSIASRRLLRRARVTPADAEGDLNCRPLSRTARILRKQH